MLFLVTYQVDRDKQIECQTFFANMTDEQIENEYPTSVKQIGRWHDVPNGNGVIIVEPVVDDQTGRKLVKELIASQS